MKHVSYSMSLFVLMVLFQSTNQAQTLTLPRVSQYAEVSQRVGLTDITIQYHSPGANGREIWGALVPYNLVWRAGANENTLISFSSDVKVGNSDLAAGTYGLYMVPNPESVDIIFSKATKNWGTVAPTEEQIAARITVKPISVDHQEWLSYDFTNRGGSEVTAALNWSTWSIPFSITVNVSETVLSSMRAELNGLPGFGYLGREQAARYCLQNAVALDEAMAWIDGSINSEKRFSNLSVKAGLLKKLGKMDESEKIMKEALAISTPNQMNFYGYQLLNSGDAKGATSIFLENIERTPKSHPFYWGFVDSVGEGYLKQGDHQNALKYYKMAKDHAPDNRHAYLDDVIKRIMDKQQ